MAIDDTKDAPRLRHWRSIVVLALVFCGIGAVIWAATRSDGRTGTQATTNDGGAWLLKRDAGAIGHLNREVLEVTAGVRVADAGADFDVDQAGDLILVHDRSTNQLMAIDGRTHLSRGSVLVPSDIVATPTERGVVLYSPQPFAVWSLSEGGFLELGDIETEQPAVQADSAGVVAITTTGEVAALVPETGDLSWIENGMVMTTVPETGLPSSVSLTTAVADQALFVSEESFAVVSPDGEVVEHTLDTALTALQQPSSAGDSLVAVTEDGLLVRIGLGSGESETITSLESSDVLPLIDHGGCQFVVMASTPGGSTPVFEKVCNGAVVEQAELTGTGAQLRLRLVNGWVWINDLDTGGAWITSPDSDLARIDDWGAALANDNLDESDATTEDGGGIEEVQINPDAEDAELVEADELDEDQENEPPVVRPDEASTRIDRPVVIPVLANDEDADGDVLLVSEVIIDGPPGVLAVITPTRDAVQLSPPAGFVGTIRFDYFVTDGRGGTGSAEVTVEVTANSAETNRPPEPVTDVAAARAGSPVSLDLLANDTDPDGDALVLLDVTGDAGLTVFDPGGQLTFTPNTTGTDAQIELAYVVADDFGATAEGRVLVNVRLEDANNPPDARNDSVVTSVGSPARVNVLENDSDPDDDPLLVARQPILISDPNGPVSVGGTAAGDGEGTTATGGNAQVTTDGEFFFVPDEPGTYLFEYLISDGQNNDKAQIRVDVDAADANKPPVAVRDDVTIPVGGTRIVYALDNDGDPNGDVVGIVEWSGTDGLLIEEIPGIGFRVTVEASAPDRAVFRYAISDGVNEPVGTAVVVSVVDVEPLNQPPIVRPDAVEVRAGRSTTIKALANDYDPEGGPLEILRAAEILGVDAEMRVGPQGQTIVLTVGPEVRRGFTFGYDVQDEDGASSASVIEVRVIAPGEPNRPPVARPDVGRTIANTAVVIEVLANDSDPDGDAIQVESIARQPANGTVDILEDGSVRYEPANDFTGTDRFSYVLIDTEGERSVGVVQVGVTPESKENRPPSANPDTFNVTAGAGPVVLDVLANDFDPDNDPLSLLSVTSTSAGDLTLNEDGSIVFVPPEELIDETATLETSFSYDLADDAGNESSATVTIVIEAAPDPEPPVAVDDQAGPVRARSTVTVNVAANDLDPDGEITDLVVTSGDADVVVTGQQVQITAGTESSQHTYTITDVDGLTATATITLFVVDNEAPVVSPLTVETANETPVRLSLAPQASDIDEDPLFFVCCDNTRGGIATIESAGEGVLDVTFEPSPGFSGEGGFSYSVDDQQGHLVSASVTVVVLPPDNRPPVATDGSVEVEAASAEKGLGVPYDLRGLVSDPDPDDTLTFDVSTNPGSVDISVSGSTVVVAAPATAAGETATVSYTVTDSFGETASGTLTVTVTPVSDPPPQAVNDTATTNQGQAIDIDVLANDVDPLGQGLSISQVGATADGATGPGAAEGSVTFTPDNEFFGTTTFTYTIRDSADADDRTGLGQVTVDVIGRPDAPAPPAATADNAVATITWNTPASNGALVEAYVLEYEDVTAGGTAQVELGAINSHTWNALTNGNEYRFRVQARNVAGWGEFSGWSAPVRPDTIPEAPAAPLVAFGDGELAVTWTAPPNDGSAITGYLLEIGAGDSQIVTLGAGTSFDWSGLTNGVEYQFRVAAVNSAGESDWSGWSASEHPLGSPLAAGPPNVNRGDQFLDITWVAPNNNGDPIQQYEVEMRSSGQVVTVADGGTTNHRWADLPNGVEQQYRVRAINRAPEPGNWSSWSLPVKPCSVPDAGGAPTVVRGDTEVVVSWTPPNDQGCAISGYTIIANGSITQTAGAGSTSHTFTGLTNGTPYTFRVIATNEEGDGAPSAVSASVTPAGPPLPGPSITSAAPTAVGQITVNYGGAAPNGSPITSHEIRIDAGGPITVPAGQYVATGLGQNRDYNFQVRACNDVGCSGWSATSTARTWGPPTVPTGVSASAGNATITAFYNPPANDGGAPGFNYAIELVPNNFSGSSAGANSFTWTGVANGTTHTIRVRACNDVGCSAWVTTTATPVAPPPAASISRGSTSTPSDCTHPSCARIFVNTSNYAPGEPITITCHSSFAGAFATYNRTSDGNGSHAGEQCYFGIPGNTVWVTVVGAQSGSVTSNSIVW